MKHLLHLQHINESRQYKSNGIAAFKKTVPRWNFRISSAEFFDNSDVTDETYDCTQYYCYNPKLLALVRCACPVWSHTNEHSIMPRGINYLWVWPKKLDSFRIVTVAAMLQAHPFSTLSWGPYFLALKAMNKRSLTQAVSKKAASSIMNILNHSVIKANFFSHLFTTLIYSQYSCLVIIYVCCLSTTQTGYYVH